MTKNIKYLFITGLILFVVIKLFKKLESKNIVKFLRPVNFKVTSNFGNRANPTNKSKPQFHNGVDFAAPLNSPVIAPFDGLTVIKNSVDGGNQLFIVTLDGFVFGFAHLNKVLVPTNTQVKRGQIVALTGNTGAHTTGAHLHFTMKKNNKFVNPLEHIV